MTNRALAAETMDKPVTGARDILSLPSEPLTARFVVVMLSCAICASASVFTLYRDLSATGAQGEGVVLAQLERHEQSVRRKARKSYLWMNVSPNQELYQKDSILTGPGGLATLKLRTGERVEMEENSLLVLDESKDLALNFLRGAMTVHAKNAVRRVTAEVGGKTKVEELRFRLLQPEAFSEKFVMGQGTAEIEFSWEIGGTAGGQEVDRGAILEISPNASFRTSRTRAVEVDGAGTSASGVWKKSVPLPAGEYFWRIRSKAQDGSGGALSQVRRLEVRQTMALKPILPSLAQTVLSWKDPASVSFTWESARESLRDSQAVHHRIELSRDSDFRNVAISQPVSGTSEAARVSDIPVGQWYWRIRSDYAGLEAVSPVRNFQIKKAEKLEIGLVSPEGPWAYSGSAKEVRFQWQTEAADHLEFQVELESQEKQKSRTVLKSAPGVPAIVWKTPERGSYKWRVRTLAEGKEISLSEWKPLSVYDGDPVPLALPAKGKKLQYTAEEPGIQFDWESAAPKAGRKIGYQWELAEDARFTTILKKERTKQNRLAVDGNQLRTGKYYWRVLVLDDNTGEVMRASEASPLYYHINPALPSPTGLQSQQEVFNLMQKEEFPILSWSPVEGATGYEVSVYSDQKNEKGEDLVIYRAITEERKVELDKLTEGKYSWSVRTRDPQGRLGDSAKREGFQVTYGKHLRSPKSRSRQVQ